jgi:hypothetical protein
MEKDIVYISELKQYFIFLTVKIKEKLTKRTLIKSDFHLFIFLVEINKLFVQQ